MLRGYASPVTVVIVIILLLVIIAAALLIARRVEGGADGRPLGDTPEAHDDISPHDIPLDHPGREAAEKMADGAGAEGTTAGHPEGAANKD